MNMKSLTLVLVGMLFAGIARAQYNQVITTPHADYKLENDIPYREAGVNPMVISNMVLFLCSDKAGFITGENICIDGGMTHQMIYHGDNGWKLEIKHLIEPKK